MVFTGFCNFLLMMFIIVLLHKRNSSALITYQDGVPDVTAEVRGRKMMLENRALRKYMKEEPSKTENAKISGAAYGDFVGNCNRVSSSGKEISDRKCKLMSDDGQYPLKKKMVGLTAFSADYHVPKPHPPKNN